MTFIVATNVVASRPPKRRPTGTPHARANIPAFTSTSILMLWLSEISHISSSTRQRAVINQPMLQMISFNYTSSGYHSNCLIPVLSTLQDLTTISRMDQAPSMVVYMGKLDHTNLINSIGPFHGPLFEYFLGSPVITVTCHGLVRQGVLYNLSHSLGHVNEMCSMKNKEIKIAYNIGGIVFSVKNQEVESATLEGAVLDTFLEKYNLRPTFIHAKQVWGAKNEISGLWNGIYGLVRIPFQNMFLISLAVVPKLTLNTI